MKLLLHSSFVKHVSFQNPETDDVKKCVIDKSNIRIRLLSEIRTDLQNGNLLCAGERIPTGAYSENRNSNFFEHSLAPINPTLTNPTH